MYNNNQQHTFILYAYSNSMHIKYIRINSTHPNNQHIQKHINRSENVNWRVIKLPVKHLSMKIPSFLLIF